MTMESWGPLAGFSISLILFLGALWVFLLCAWITVPFSLFAIRKQLKQQNEVLQRIEQHLGALPLVRLEPPAPAPPQASPPLPSTSFPAGPG